MARPDSNASHLPSKLGSCATTMNWVKLIDLLRYETQIGSSARPSNPTDISSDAATFLDGTFLIDYVQRPTASELLSQPFLRVG